MQSAANDCFPPFATKAAVGPKMTFIHLEAGVRLEHQEALASLAIQTNVNVGKPMCSGILHMIEIKEQILE